MQASTGEEVGGEFPLECPACGGGIRLIAFRLVDECENIPGFSAQRRLERRIAVGATAASPPRASVIVAGSGTAVSVKFVKVPEALLDERPIAVMSPAEVILAGWLVHTV